MARKPYFFVDGIHPKRAWGGSFENVAVMAAIGVNDDGCREVIGAAEGFTVSAECWRGFLLWLKGRGLSGVRMFTGDKAAAIIGVTAEAFPDAAYQRCTAHFCRNVLSKAPKARCRQVAAMFKAIHAQESMGASLGKDESVAEALESMKLKEVAKCACDSVAEALSYTRFPMEHWGRIRMNNAEPRDKKENTGGRHLPRRQERADAGDGHTQVRGRQQVGIEKVSGCHAAGRMTILNRIGRLIQSAQDY